MPNTTRSTSASAMVSAVPTVGPSSEYIPPSTTANTMRSETPMPASVSGFTYAMYCAYAMPPTAVRAAGSTVMAILKRVTWMPTEAGAVSSSPIASMAERAIARPTRCHTHSPSAHSTSAAEEKTRFSANRAKAAGPRRKGQEAAEQGPRPADERPDEDLDDHVEDVLAHAAHRDEGGDHECREQDAEADAAGAHARLAKRPPGRTKIMMT